MARRCEELAVRRLRSSAAAVDDEFDACDVGGVIGVKACHVSWPGEFGISRKFLGVGN